MRLLRRFANDPRASTALLELASRLPPRCAPPLARRVLRTLTEVLHLRWMLVYCTDTHTNTENTH